MKSFTYSDYAAQIAKDVEYGMSQLNFSLNSAIGFAENELAIRREWFPAEAPMLFIASAAYAIRHQAFDAYKDDEFYSLELQNTLEPDKLAQVFPLLSGSELRQFNDDLELVVRASRGA